MVNRPVLRYHGGKWLLAKWIISHFPPHRIYTEAFGGAGSVLMQKPRSYSEVYNDKWNTVVNVFRVLRSPVNAAELERQLYLTPYSRTEFMECGEASLENISDPIELARRTILRSFAGFGSASTNNKHSTGFRADSNRSGTTPARDFMNYPTHIQSFVDRLRGVVIENKDYREVLQQHDTAQTLHFLDPPYVHDTRNLRRGNAYYAFEMSDDDHREMASVVSGLQGMVIICGYDSPLYAEILGSWTRISRSAYADGASKRIECLWLNEAAARQSGRLFTDKHFTNGKGPTI